jgi:hypothetical protein
MNNRFLETICDTYVNKNSILTENFNFIKTEKFKNDILNELKSQLNILCEQDRSIYEDLRKSSKVTQGMIIERYLDLVYKDEDYILETIDNTYHQLEKNMFDLDYIYGENFFENLDPNYIDSIIIELEQLIENEIKTNITDEKNNENIALKKRFNIIQMALAGIAGGTISPIVFKIISKLLSGSSSTLSTIFSSSLLTGVSLGILVILLFIFLLLRRKWNRQFFRLANIVFNWIRKGAKTILSGSNYFRIRYTIMEKNTKNCYSKCGVLDKNNIPISDYIWNIKQDSIEVDPTVKTTIGYCLAECYLNQYILVLAMLFESYINCLKNTGNLNIVKFNLASNVSYRDINGTISDISDIANVKTCSVFFTEFKNGLDIFNDLTNTLFENEDSVLKTKYFMMIYEHMAKIYNRAIKEQDFEKKNLENKNYNYQDKNKEKREQKYH